MSDQMRLERGGRGTSTDAELGATYHFYDVPLVGHVRQVGADYLFHNLFGHNSENGIWAYVLLGEAEVEELDHGVA